MEHTILVVEDEQGIREAIGIYMKNQGYNVILAANGKEGLEKIETNDIHLAIVDIMMPVMDGISMVMEARKHHDFPILFLSAKSEDIDKITGLNIGADDYITKPFSMEELVFRVEAILRRVRGKKSKESTMYHIGDFTFDTQKQLLTIGEKQTKLTTKENELLALLCAHSNEILQRDFALKTIWIDDNYFNARSMDVYITKLRKHLKDDPQIEIINIHGKGYKLIVPNED